jgi:hypothetical protein
MRNVFTNWEDAKAYQDKFGSSKDRFEIVIWKDTKENVLKYSVVAKPRKYKRTTVIR